MNQNNKLQTSWNHHKTWLSAISAIQIMMGLSYWIDKFKRMKSNRTVIIWIVLNTYHAHHHHIAIANKTLLRSYWNWTFIIETKSISTLEIFQNELNKYPTHRYINGYFHDIPSYQCNMNRYSNNATPYALENLLRLSVLYKVSYISKL